MVVLFTHHHCSSNYNAREMFSTHYAYLVHLAAIIYTYKKQKTCTFFRFLDFHGFYIFSCFNLSVRKLYSKLRHALETWPNELVCKIYKIL